ncbi:MAG TPA: 3-isopropylmalate dehydratase small subunit [Acidobacteriota bacterium]|nr:3-isopropylmalate dehydratase small subunit [Acidobacteriota bacterium]
MTPFRKHRGLVATLDRVNVDTDQIIPKQFLKRIERTGFGQFLFFDWRFKRDGTPDPDFELNQSRFEGASILLTRDNFGCGSSREHAPWALLDYGFQVLIAPSFADIFYNNCFKNGMLPVRLPERQVEELFRKVRDQGRLELTVDLEQQEILEDSGAAFDFEIDPFRRKTLLEGLDEISLTLKQEDAIRSYERRRICFRDAMGAFC